MPLTDFVFDNGIRLIAEPIASTKAAAIGFWFSCGSRDESDVERGVTHFIEHMLFKGTATRSAFDIALFFDRIGGYVNAFTEREHMCLYCVVPAEHSIAALECLSDMLGNSVFSPDEIEKEREVIISEIVSSYDDPEEMGMDAVLASIYGDHPIAHPIAGTIDEVKRLSPEAIRDAYRSYIARNAPVVACAGRIDVDAISAKLADTSFFSRTDETCSLRAIAPTWHAERRFIRSDFQQSQVFYSLPLADSRAASYWFSWSIVNTIIGDSVSSRLFQNLREKRGLCYALYSFYFCNRDSSAWSAYLSVPPAKTDEAVEQLLIEMRIVADKGIADDEIAYARDHIAGELLLSSEDTENRMKRLARQFFYGGEIRTIDEAVSLVRNLDSRDIRSVAAEAFCDQRVSCIVYGKKKVKKDALWL